MYRRYLPIFEFIKSTPELANLISVLKENRPCIGYAQGKPIFTDFIYCYEKLVGKDQISIKAYINYPTISSSEKMLNVSRELMDQRVWFTCDHQNNYDALMAVLPEYRETVGVDLRKPCLVFYSKECPVLAGFN